MAAKNDWSYCTFIDTTIGQERIGHYDQLQGTIQPLSFASGTPLRSLYEVIQLDAADILPAGDLVQRSAVVLLPPVSDRDILCVGKNYASHAKEFNQSGFDASDKVDQPSHPVIFTKRFSSIIADGDEILAHPEFTQSIDYEGEIGVIIGKAGFRISEADAMEYVWGYTVVNDLTARERQRDHKQFYIGKSADTFCPLGPVAVSKTRFDGALRVETHINGELRQNGTTDELIFSIPTLIKTLSEGQTLMPGDLIATGTPAGVAIGQSSPVYLKPGDEVKVSVPGIGTLKNRIASRGAENPTLQRVTNSAAKAIQLNNGAKTFNGVGLQVVRGKPTNILRMGIENGTPAVFIHGLGGTIDYWSPLVKAAALEDKHSIYLFDFEGHGLTPTSPLSKISIASLAADIKGIFDHVGITSGATLFAHSMGCLVAVQFVLDNPTLVSKLVLVGPPPSPLPSAASANTHARATTVRAKTMSAVAGAVATGGTAAKTQAEDPLAIAAVRLSLLGQDPEGYAKACDALANATDTLDFTAVKAETLIVTGIEDKISPPTLCQRYEKELPRCKGVVVLPDVGHWHVFEDVKGVADAVRSFV